MAELTRDGQPAPILLRDESAGWESGTCAPPPDSEPDDDGAEAAEQLDKLQCMLDHALARRRQRHEVLQWAREHGPSPTGGAS